MSDDTSPLTFYLTLLHDDIDLLGHLLINADGEERLEYWEAFYEAYKNCPFKSRTHGRAQNRYILCRMATALSIASELSKGNEVSTDFPGDFPLYELGEWAWDDWNSFLDAFIDLSRSLIRRDANFMSFQEPNPDPLPERSDSPLYNAKFEKLVRYIKCNRAVAPFRKAIAKQLKNENLQDDQTPKIAGKLLMDFQQQADEEEDEHVSQLLSSLLDKNNNEDSKPQLASLGELRRIFGGKPFLFEKLQAVANSLLRAWMDDTFGAPLLEEVYFSSDEVQNLRQARGALNRSGVDPLDDALRAASLAKGGEKSPVSVRRTPGPSAAKSSGRRRRKRGYLISKKSGAAQLDFEDSDGEDEIVEDEMYDPDDEGAGLSDLPRKRSQTPQSSPRKRRRSQQKKYEGRRPWTDEEKFAVKEGIKKFGMGKWRETKDEYEVILSARTTVQIKDCARTMKIKGELDFLPDDAEADAAS